MIDSCSGFAGRRLDCANTGIVRDGFGNGNEDIELDSDELTIDLEASEGLSVLGYFHAGSAFNRFRKVGRSRVTSATRRA